ncbi:Lipin/Ned1/Smp2-domain-containing protein [Delphinella strobiligena]|nr:Lipin/Ned1/Smp2-domain-containing protein [Delphinella strobiligena]
MQYVRSLSGSVSKTWNSINPATLSGAIDVIVVEQEDGSLACSPFHVRFGKFSLLRPYEKKVEFKVNDERRNFPMKLGEGGEAFFVFETSSSVPEALQTSPLVSPATSPQVQANNPSSSSSVLPEPELLELDPQSASDSLTAPVNIARQHSKSLIGLPKLDDDDHDQRAQSHPTPLSISPDNAGAMSDGWPAHAHALPPPPSRLERAATDDVLPHAKAAIESSILTSEMYPPVEPATSTRPTARTDRSASPPPVSPDNAMTRAIALSKKLWGSNIPSQVTDKGDIMLDMTGYKSSEDEALRAEVVARKILSEELEGNYDIGALIGADEKGNLWIYSSEEARDKANQKAANAMGSLQRAAFASTDALSDPGYASDDSRSEASAPYTARHTRHDSDSALGLSSASPSTSGDTPTAGDPNRNYAKTLRLTSEQLESLNLKSGPNTMSFTVNRATCTATIYRWKYDVPIVISDIDGTITKSDALGHVLNMIGRDWTHLGVAKLYTEIAANGYNLLYLTSRSVGQADTTRAYLAGVVQDGGYRLPKGPVIMSPDRTIAALRREVYLRKPEVFKMACLRDIMALFTGSGGSNNAATAGPTLSRESSNGLVGADRGKGGSPFYAGFGNRLTDALSYRSVNIPSTRIFTINSNAEVSLDLLTLTTYKTGYVSMREIVDHYFPPVGLLVKGGGEEFTDFNYWREKTLDITDFSDSESGSDSDDEPAHLRRSGGNSHRSGEAVYSEDEGDAMGDSYISEARRDSEDGAEALYHSIVESVEDPDDYIHENEEECEEDEEYEEEEEDTEAEPEAETASSPGSIEGRLTPR